MPNSPQNPNGPGDLLLDANGAAVTVGATVKLVGVVSSVDALSKHYRDVQITLSHPLTGVSQTVQGVIEGAHITQPGSVLTVSVPACMLVVGA